MRLENELNLGKEKLECYDRCSEREKCQLFNFDFVSNLNLSKNTSSFDWDWIILYSTMAKLDLQKAWPYTKFKIT